MAVAFPEFDSEMMAVALRMAECGLGATAPNPSVGAVIADDGSAHAPYPRTAVAEHEHAPSFPLEGPQPGTWSTQS